MRSTRCLARSMVLVVSATLALVGPTFSAELPSAEELEQSPDTCYVLGLFNPFFEDSTQCLVSMQGAAKEGERVHNPSYPLYTKQLPSGWESPSRGDDDMFAILPKGDDILFKTYRGFLRVDGKIIELRLKPPEQLAGVLLAEIPPGRYTLSQYTVHYFPPRHRLVKKHPLSDPGPWFRLEVPLADKLPVSQFTVRPGEVVYVGSIGLEESFSAACRLTTGVRATLMDDLPAVLAVLAVFQRGLAKAVANCVVKAEYLKNPNPTALRRQLVEWAEKLERPCDLHEAASSGYPAGVEALLKEGVDVNAKDSDGVTPLHLTAWKGHIEVARLLLEHNADIDAENDHGDTPLHLAAWKGHIEVARLLLEHNADIDAENDRSNTPLHIAAEYGHDEMAELLLEHNADVGAKNDVGDTPLHLAAYWDYVELARLLLGQGADINAKRRNGWTPLHVAARWGHYKTVEVLLHNGADVNAKGDDDATPLCLAKEHKYTATCRLLREHGGTTR